MSVADVGAARELVASLPTFAQLPEAVRALVADSFEPLAYAFGELIVEEGEDADAFYVLAAGTARVLKRGEDGSEVPLNVLRRGDTFGEMGLLEQARRLATVRASSPVEVLRLDRGVFVALTRANPEMRASFEALARRRQLWNFFRLHPSFAQLPDDALGTLVDGLERVEVRPGELIIREGDPPGPMYVVAEGRLRAFTYRAGSEIDLAYLRRADVLGERSLLLGEPRAASVEAVSECELLRLPRLLFERLLAEQEEFRARIEQRIAQYDYRRLARVPLDSTSSRRFPRTREQRRRSSSARWVGSERSSRTSSARSI